MVLLALHAPLGLGLRGKQVTGSLCFWPLVRVLDTLLTSQQHHIVYTFGLAVLRMWDNQTIAMANAGRNTNGSQFFIMHQDYPLPKNYTIFGITTDGLDVIDNIANVPVSANPSTGEPSTPTEEVTIIGIDITEM